VLVLPVHEMRLHIHPFEGSGDGLCGSFHRPKEPITVTPAEIIYQRRIAVLDHAQRTGNVTEACRVFGISRTRYYEWKNVADRYGLEALMPRARRKPQMPEATPTHVIETLLTLAVTQPTIGCRQYADRLFHQGFSISKSTVQKHLVAHGLGKRAQRLARVAAIAAATTGLVVPEVLRKDEPFGFCLATGGPGELVCLDSFYIGKLKGVGKVYQLTAIDVFTRFAVVSLVLGTPTGAMTARFIHQALRLYRRHGVRVRAILTDNGGEYVAGAFVDALAAKGLRHERIPARSPNHNAVCERFQGTMLQECWRPAFHRRHFTSIRQLQAEADAWLITYNHRRRNHGDYMRGRTPREILDSHKRSKAA
jgi:transposase InsO family protein